MDVLSSCSQLVGCGSSWALASALAWLLRLCLQLACCFGFERQKCAGSEPIPPVDSSFFVVGVPPATCRRSYRQPPPVASRQLPAQTPSPAPAFCIQMSLDQLQLSTVSARHVLLLTNHGSAMALALPGCVLAVMLCGHV